MSQFVQGSTHNGIFIINILSKFSPNRNSYLEDNDQRVPNPVGNAMKCERGDQLNAQGGQDVGEQNGAGGHRGTGQTVDVILKGD